MLRLIRASDRADVVKGSVDLQLRKASGISKCLDLTFATSDIAVTTPSFPYLLESDSSWRPQLGISTSLWART